MKLLFDLNSLRPLRNGIGDYTLHLLEGLRTPADIDDLAGWVGSDLYANPSRRRDDVRRRSAAKSRAVQRRHADTVFAYPSLYEGFGLPVA